MSAPAGLALLPSIANSLYTAVAAAATRETAIVTRVVTAAGLTRSEAAPPCGDWSRVCLQPSRFGRKKINEKNSIPS